MIKKLDMIDVSLMKVRLVLVILISVKLEIIRLRRKVKKYLSSKKLSKSKKRVGSDFLILEAKLLFTKLKQAFVKALILYYFDLEHYIQVETDISGYAIGGVFGKLTLDN